VSTNRYVPRDRVTKTPTSTGRSDATITNRSRTTKPRTTSRRISTGSVAGGADARVGSTPILTPTSTDVTAVTTGGGGSPTLVPRVATPRLGAPRSAYPRSSIRTSTTVSNCNTLFNGYWGYSNCNYWGYGNYNSCYGLTGWGFGFGGLSYWNDPWYWNIGVCSPWNAFRLNYWNNCYQNCYWNNWCGGFGLASNYWWYPTTTYCPTYLYVPSSVVYVESGFANELYGDLSGDEGRIVDVVRAGEAPARAEDRGDSTTPEAIARGYIELGDHYFRLDKFEEAADAYSKARSYLPEDASVHFILADAVFANGDYHYAAFLIAEAVRLDPSIVTADVDKRDVYSDHMIFDNQMEALQKYCADKPYDAWAHLVLGYNMRFSDRPTRSVSAFRRVLEIDRDNPTARAFLADLVPSLRTDPDTTPGKKSVTREGAAKPTERPKIK